MVTRDSGVRGVGRCFKLLVIRLTSSGALMYSIVIIVNNTVIYLKVAKRVAHNYSHKKKEVTIIRQDRGVS